jgi:hypothetical protein
MRLFRMALLGAVPPIEGGCEAESRHPRALPRSGGRVASVEIPTIYDDEPGHFHPLVDTLRVARAAGAEQQPGLDRAL